jgi:hypothetical protein
MYEDYKNESDSDRDSGIENMTEECKDKYHTVSKITWISMPFFIFVNKIILIV